MNVAWMRLSTLTRVGLVLLVCATGCRRHAADREVAGRLVVGYSLADKGDAWRMAQTHSIRLEAVKRRIDLRCVLGQGTQDEQIEALRSFIAQHVDVILLSPVVETGWDLILGEVAAAGIPIILLDGRADLGDGKPGGPCIAPDSVEEGRVAARWLGERLAGRGRIIELEGTAGDARTVERRKGFQEGLQDYPGLKVVRSLTADFQQSQGKEVMEAMLKAVRKVGVRIDAVFAHNDAMAFGAIEAMDEAGWRPGLEVVTVSIGGGLDAFRAMSEGRLNCTVERNPLYGPFVFDAVEKVAAGLPLAPWIRIPTRYFIAPQAAELMTTRLY